MTSAAAAARSSAGGPALRGWGRVLTSSPTSADAVAGPTRSGSKPSGYLTGLDGIRAIAVLGVLLYHFEAPFAQGGFLGVDVFFVLSGYLISSRLWAQWAGGRPDLKAFWLGRIRRLFPAVLALIAVTTVAVLAMDREHLASYVGDVFAASTYTSNWWYVLHERSYFEAAGRPPVLQHLWSLAVEEQYYVVWPLVVLAVFRFTPRRGERRRLLATIALALGLVSALVMGIGSAVTHVPQTGDPSRWYFGTDSHAMGLLFGAALAFVRGGAGFGAHLPAQRPATPRATGIGVGALVVLLACIGLVDEFSTALYRIGFLLIAILTTVLVAVASRPGLLETALSGRVLTYLGRRSYGLYLWHWPVAAFTRPELDVPLDGVALFSLRFALTLALAEACFQLVEEPVRRHGWRRPWPTPIPWGRTLRLPALQLAAGLAAVLLLPPLFAPVTAATTHLAASPAPEAPAPNPTVPPSEVGPRHDLTATVYGDSVAKGAHPAFASNFRTVTEHAGVGEQSWDMLPALTADARSGRITSDVVVISTGNNGVIQEEQLRSALSALQDAAPVKAVVLITPKNPKPWAERATRTLLDVTPEYPKARLARWDEYGQGHRDWFVDDGIHLQPIGRDNYVRLVLSALSPLLPPPPAAATPTGTATTPSR